MSAPKVIQTSTWPAVQHVCGPDTETVYFRGPCKTGARVTCQKCLRTFVYIKPAPRR